MSEKKPVASDGGSSSYYDLALPDWLIDLIIDRGNDGDAFVKTEELIEVLFKNDYDFGCSFKALVRARGAFDGGGKLGNSVEYDCTKVRYYSDKIKEKSKRT